MNGQELHKDVYINILTGAFPNDLRPLTEGYPAVFILCDKKILHLAEKLSEVLPNFKAIMSLEASEGRKNMDSAMEVCAWLLGNNADREDLLLVIGGGICTDIGGFAACIYKRGMHFAFVPTTLLSQIDASIGGKTGVNFLSFKNMLGVIRQGDFSFICPDLLESLPEREWRCGCAELIKIFVINNKSGYYEVIRGLFSEPFSPSKKSSYTAIIPEAARVKASIVSQDPYDTGIRRTLNLGHSFAHAIEALALQTREDIHHGEAVAMGLTLAARLSDRLGKSRSPIESVITSSLLACGLPVESPYQISELIGFLRKDKKAGNGVINLVLPIAIGEVEIIPLRLEDIQETLER